MFKSHQALCGFQSLKNMQCNFKLQSQSSIATAAYHLKAQRHTLLTMNLAQRAQLTKGFKKVMTDEKMRVTEKEIE